ncbi:MAG TPA: diguanylate cyclase response regulator, partial [Cyanobacteria bacterium UBA9273]|nr:diguanylate cyclase response regulator [Cyanobacteria bacterium UBA9273]
GDILVVDDMPDNLRLLSTMLAQRGYKVRKAVSGAMALISAESILPDLILLDINMPQ